MKLHDFQELVRLQWSRKACRHKLISAPPYGRDNAVEPD